MHHSFAKDLAALWSQFEGIQWKFEESLHGNFLEPTWPKKKKGKTQQQQHMRYA